LCLLFTCAGDDLEECMSGQIRFAAVKLSATACVGFLYLPFMLLSSVLFWLSILWCMLLLLIELQRNRRVLFIFWHVYLLGWRPLRDHPTPNPPLPVPLPWKKGTDLLLF